MEPIISAITPASRGVKELSNLLNDFKNQTFRNFEHIIVYDGTPPDDVIALMKNAGPWTRFCHIEKDYGNMKESPGTKPRNHGIKLSRGQYLVFCDDDDRYKDTYLETLISNCRDNIIGVIQMSCQQSRMYKDGDPDTIVLKFKPIIQITGGMLVDVDGLVIKDMRDWVSFPPFYRGTT